MLEKDSERGKAKALMKARNVIRKIGADLLQYMIILIGVTLISFFILHLAPGNPAEIWLIGTDGHAGQVSEEAIAAQEEKMGLDDPFIVQYGRWLGRVLQGDLGESMTTRQPVAEEIAEHLIPTIELSLLSLAVTMAIALPLGVYCAVHKDKLLDNIVRGFSFLGISLPSFFVSLVLLWLFCLKLNWFPIIAKGGIEGMILPMCVFVIQCVSKLVRQIRALVLEEMQQGYVKGAVARGVDQKTILFSHVLKNCTIPILSLVSVYLGILLGGAAVVETIFSFEGIGKLAVEAVSRLDYYTIQGIVLWVAVLFLAINFVIDAISAAIDPRIKGSR